MGGDFDPNDIDPDATYGIVVDTGCPGADAAIGAVIEDYGGIPTEVEITPSEE